MDRTPMSPEDRAEVIILTSFIGGVVVIALGLIGLVLGAVALEGAC